ncbi:MAG TPA: hypothetical protein VLC10_03470 [Patescibacteria group bacterium]|nr:hypothetical protein [Patescibacteria group bacterium]
MTTKALSRELLRNVLCCAECEQPLHIDRMTGGAYCTHCNYPPSMQDTFIMRITPCCGKEVRRDGDALACKGCGQRYA